VNADPLVLGTVRIIVLRFCIASITNSRGYVVPSGIMARTLDLWCGHPDWWFHRRTIWSWKRHQHCYFKSNQKKF